MKKHEDIKCKGHYCIYCYIESDVYQNEDI